VTAVKVLKAGQGSYQRRSSKSWAEEKGTSYVGKGRGGVFRGGKGKETSEQLVVNLL